MGPPEVSSLPTVGSRHHLSITDLAFGGEGVGRIGEFVVFVPFVIPGEEVEVEVTEVKRQFARAKLIRVVRASEQRVTPRCRYFGECGGCQYQHIAYATQLEFKRRQVADLFERIGGVAREVVAPVVPCPRLYGYRNRIMVRSQWDKFKQGLNIGFIRHDNRLVVDIEECPIAEPALSDQIRSVRAHPPPKGGIKITLRAMPEDWEVPRDSFFQTNFHILPELVRVARERLQSAGTRYLVDAYCGVGFFSLELADLVEGYLGLELDPQAVKAARRNADRRGRTRGEFRLGATEELLPGVVKALSPAQTTVILDPPRAGCLRPAIDALRVARPAQVIYVSCHPATLARDVGLLCGEGAFTVREVVPLDLFPQTQHVECVADLRATP